MPAWASAVAQARPEKLAPTTIQSGCGWSRWFSGTEFIDEAICSGIRPYLLSPVIVSIPWRDIVSLSIAQAPYPFGFVNRRGLVSLQCVEQFIGIVPNQNHGTVFRPDELLF